MEFRLRPLNAQRVAAHFAAGPDLAKREFLAAMQSAVLLLQRETVERTPTGAYQLLRKSIIAAPVVARGARVTGEVNTSDISGVYGSVLNYAVPVELGTRPHRPPIAPLIDWVKAKFGSTDSEARGKAFAVAKKIAKRGTQPKKMFQITFDEQAPQIERIFERALDRVINQL